MRKLSILWLLVTLLRAPAWAQDAVSRVFVDHKNQTHVVYISGQSTIVAPEPGEIGIDSVQVTEDARTAGWLVLFENPDGGSPVAGVLLVWRDGKVARRFGTGQTFWSWGFFSHDAEVAFHTGPMHGETESHCELRSVASGRLIASWDGDLDNANRPEWTKVLDH